MISFKSFFFNQKARLVLGQKASPLAVGRDIVHGMGYELTASVFEYCRNCLHFSDTFEKSYQIPYLYNLNPGQFLCIVEVHTFLLYVDQHFVIRNGRYPVRIS